MNVPAQGDHPKVTPENDQTLKEAVTNKPRQLGENSSVWDCNQLALYLEKEGGTKVSRETVRRHLPRLNYRIVRPVLSVKSPDPEYATKAQALLELQKQAERGEIILLYQDEVDLKRLPGIIGGWTERGNQWKVSTPPDNQKRYGFGAETWTTNVFI
jgi:hypothetical protein